MTKKERTIWKFGINRVTTRFIHTRRRTISLNHIDLVELHRPYLAPAIGVTIPMNMISVRFQEVLTLNEHTMLMVPGWMACVIAMQIARLRLHSYSLKDLSITMPIWRGRAMRAAIDQVLMEYQADQPDPPHHAKGE